MTPGRIQFGAFEADAEAGEIFKRGIRLHIPDQSVQILLTLLNHPGKIVSREELRQQLWGNDTFVDFEQGLNSAMMRLREALNDSVEHPQFIETVRGRGYRFVGQICHEQPSPPTAREVVEADQPLDPPVQRHVQNPQATVYAYPAELEEWRESREYEQVSGRALRARVVGWATVVVATLLIAGGAAWWQLRRVEALRPTSVPTIASRIFARVAAEGGQPRWIPTGPRPSHLARNPNNGEIYVLTEGSLQAFIDVGQPSVRDLWRGVARSMAIRRDGSLLAIGTADNRVLLLTPAGRVLQTFALQNPPAALVFSADGQDLFVAAVFSGLKRIHVPSRELLTVSSMSGRCPVNLALSADGRRLYVDYQCGAPKGGHNEIDVLDADTGKSLGLMTGFANVGNPFAVSPNGAEVWANAGDACSNPNYDHVGCPQSPAHVLNVIRTDDNRLVHSFAFPVERPLGSITFLPDGSRALIGGSPLQVVDTASLSVVESYPLMTAGQSVFGADGKRLYIPAYDNNAIAVIELDENCRPAPAGLASWWPGDGNANDVRSANNAEFADGVNLLPGIAGEAFSFDGTGSLRVPKLANVFTSETRIFTMTGWIRLSRKGSAAPIFEISDRSAGNPLWRLELRADDSLTFCEWNDDKTCTAPVAQPTALEPGLWYHFAAVHDSRNITFAVNGRVAGAAPTKPRSFGERWFTANFGGDHDRKSFLAGSLDELQLYNRALGATEIQDLYQSRPFGTCYR